MISLGKGSPRDLLALVEGGRGVSDATINLVMTEDYYQFDELKDLIPEDCVINEQS